MLSLKSQLVLSDKQHLSHLCTAVTDSYTERQTERRQRIYISPFRACAFLSVYINICT